MIRITTAPAMHAASRTRAARRCLRLAGTAAAVLWLGSGAGCGGASRPTGLTSSQQATLLNGVTAVRAAAAGDDPVAARAALAQLRREVGGLGRTGALSQAAVHTLMLEINRAAGRVGPDIPTAVTPRAPAPAPPTGPGGQPALPKSGSAIPGNGDQGPAPGQGADHGGGGADQGGGGGGGQGGGGGGD